MRLLTIGNDAKTVKGHKKGVRTAILYLSPTTISGRNFCPWSSAGCRAACLNTAGRGIMTNVQQARLERSKLLNLNGDAFMAALKGEIAMFAALTSRSGLIPAVRLNGTSDLDWGDVIDSFPHIQFYDYTKSLRRVIDNRRKNYWLTFSRSETNHDDCISALEAGFNVAAVFANRPRRYEGFPVIDGDDTDVRFMDPQGVWVGLSPKGKAKKDMTGFVIR